MRDSVTGMLTKYSPRVKVIVHGGPAATEAFLESCASIRTMTKDIYAPAEGESVQIGQNTNSYSISLSDQMLASVRMSRVVPKWAKALLPTLAHIFGLYFFGSSRTTRSALSRGESLRVRARTCPFSNRPIKRPTLRVTPPRRCPRCLVQDQRSACPTRR